MIDTDGTVRHAVINDLPLGRNIDEMLRMVDAMLFTNEYGEVCPAGWQDGKEGMKPDADGVANYLAKIKMNFNKKPFVGFLRLRFADYSNY